MLRTLTCGLLAGALLSAARIPLGFDPFSMAAVEAGTSYGVRAAAWLALALALALSGGLFDTERRPAAGLCLGATLGFALHARFQLQYGASGLTLPVLGVVVLAGGFVLVARRIPSSEPKTLGLRDAPLGLGLAACGAGLALAFEGVARHGRVLSDSSALDDTVLAVVLLLSLAIGGQVFGSLFRTPAARRIGLPVSAGIAALLCCVSLRSIGQLSSARGWDRFVREYGMLSYHRGNGLYDLVLGGVLFTLPALALGTALHCARRFEWSALFVGGAIGLSSVQALIGQSQIIPALGQETAASSAGLIVTGTMLAGVGALVACLVTRNVSLPGRIVGAVLALVILAASSFVPRDAVVIIAPWAKVQVLPTLVLETPEGLLTVEPTGIGIERVTLDRRALAPDAKSAPRDSAHLEATFELLPESVRERGGLRVLLVGQLTPGRAVGLSRQPIQTLDRTGAWHASMPSLERHLFRDSAQESLPGIFLSPDAARQRYEAGNYDLVWIPLAGGECPIADLDALAPVPPGTTVVAWIEAGRYAAQRSLPERGLLATSYPTGLSVALVLGEDLTRFDRAGPSGFRFVELGSKPQPYSVFEDLRLLAHERAGHSTAAFSERLRLANEGGEFEAFLNALAHFHAIQIGSSPWATDAEATELDEDTLTFLSALPASAPPDRSLRLWIQQLAEILIGKRRIDWIAVHIAPLAERWAPWPELELTLIEADLEGLLFDRVLERLDQRVDSGPREALLRARALVGLERPDEALGLLAEAYRSSGQAAELLRAPFADLLVRLEPGHALERLAGLGSDLAQDSRLTHAIQERELGEDHHDH